MIAFYQFNFQFITFFSLMKSTFANYLLKKRLNLNASWEIHLITYRYMKFDEIKKRSLFEVIKCDDNIIQRST